LAAEIGTSTIADLLGPKNQRILGMSACDRGFAARFASEKNCETLLALRDTYRIDPNSVFMLCCLQTTTRIFPDDEGRQPPSRREALHFSSALRKAAIEVKSVLVALEERVVIRFGTIELTTEHRVPLGGLDCSPEETAPFYSLPSLLVQLAEITERAAGNKKRATGRPREQAVPTFLRYWRDLAMQSCGRPLHEYGRDLFAVTFGRKISKRRQLELVRQRPPRGAGNPPRIPISRI
jgi:hypothetical protein